MDHETQLAAIADPTRRSILEALAAQPSSVGRLAKGFPISRPAVSQHLRVLREAGMVTVATHGTRNVYRVDPQGLEVLRRYLDDLWSAALGGLRAAAESEDDHEPR